MLQKILRGRNKRCILVDLSPRGKITPGIKPPNCDLLHLVLPKNSRVIWLNTRERVTAEA